MIEPKYQPAQSNIIKILAGFLAASCGMYRLRLHLWPPNSPQISCVTSSSKHANESPNDGSIHVDTRIYREYDSTAVVGCSGDPFHLAGIAEADLT